jgi:hypothetical protein
VPAAARSSTNCLWLYLDLSVARRETIENAPRSTNRMDVTSKYAIAIGNAANAEEYGGAHDYLLFVIGSSEYDLDLIHAGKRLAEALRAAWTVVNVQIYTYPLRRHRRLPTHGAEQGDQTVFAIDAVFYL